MSAQVTEKHIDLVRCVLDAEWWGSNVEKRFAQIIADSEAKATAEWQDFVHLKGEAIDSLLLECDRLRAEVKRLTAACDKFSNAEITQGDWKSRAERAEAELHALRLICGTTDADRFSTWVDRANARAEKAEAELATERDIVSRIWVQLGSPTYEQLKGRSIYDLIDEMRAELATEREKAERYRLASLKLDAELATERARRDWLGSGFWITGEPCDRAAIDAAMKEEKP